MDKSYGKLFGGRKRVFKKRLRKQDKHKRKARSDTSEEQRVNDPPQPTRSRKTVRLSKWVPKNVTKTHRLTTNAGIFNRAKSSNLVLRSASMGMVSKEVQARANADLQRIINLANDKENSSIHEEIEEKISSPEDPFLELNFSSEASKIKTQHDFAKTTENSTLSLELDNILNCPADVLFNHFNPDPNTPLFESIQPEIAVARLRCNYREVEKRKTKECVRRIHHYLSDRKTSIFTSESSYSEVLRELKDFTNHGVRQGDIETSSDFHYHESSIDVSEDTEDVVPVVELTYFGSHLGSESPGRDHSPIFNFDPVSYKTPEVGISNPVTFDNFFNGLRTSEIYVDPSDYDSSRDGSPDPSCSKSLRFEEHNPPERKLHLESSSDSVESSSARLREHLLTESLRLSQENSPSPEWQYPKRRMF